MLWRLARQHMRFRGARGTRYGATATVMEATHTSQALVFLSLCTSTRTPGLIFVTEKKQLVIELIISKTPSMRHLRIGSSVLTLPTNFPVTNRMSGVLRHRIAPGAT